MRRTSVTILVAAAAVGCGDSTGPREPTPGSLTVSFAGPQGVSTGAVVVSLSGPEAAANIRTVNPANRVYSRSGTVSKAVVFGTIKSGPLLRFDVPDTGDAEAWSVALVEAAGTDNAVKSLTGYTVTVSD